MGASPIPDSSLAAVTCRICSKSGAFPKHRAREMMFGTREAFEYFECSACGCVQISEIPEDLTRFEERGLAPRPLYQSSFRAPS